MLGTTLVLSQQHYNQGMRKKLSNFLAPLTAAIAVAILVFESKAMSKTTEPALSWIPQDTTSLTVINSPLTYYRENSQPIDPESMFEFVAVRPILWSPYGADWEESRWLKPADIAKIAYIQTERFQLKEPYWCSIAFLRSNPKLEKHLLETMRKCAKKEISIFGTPTFKFEDAACKDEPVKTEYRALIAPGVLVSTNEEKYIAHLLMQRKYGNTLKNNLIEWEGLDTLSSYWGFRQFPKKEREQLGDKEALGYNFEYDKASGILELRYFTHGESLPDPGFQRVLSMVQSPKQKNYRSSLSDVTVFSWECASDPKMGNSILPMVGPMMGGLAGAANTLKDEPNHVLNNDDQN